MEIVKIKTHISNNVPIDISDYIKFDNAIVGVFDFLGFKNILSSHGNLKQFAGSIEFISNIVVGMGEEKTIFEYNGKVSELKPKILQISDTFIIYSPNSEPQDIKQFLWNVSSMLFHSIFFNFPMRGAISIGEIMINESKRIFIGQAILEAMEYEKNQEWSGACLTKSLEKHIELLKIKDYLSSVILEYNIPFKENYFEKGIHAVNWPSAAADLGGYISPIIIQSKFPPFKTNSEENKIINTKKFLSFTEKNSINKLKVYFEKNNNLKK